ncbi:MAG: IPT/TIG domain-containing protein [Spirochaetaceae bacterium]|jgi:hypothetical protein|nr:IPT/TIG domain-containing protein [Spirochaetaceae bacterium]
MINSNILLRYAALLPAACVFVSCHAGGPRITSLNPRIGTAGGELSINGENFGGERDEAYVSFGGVMPTQSSYKVWTDNFIVVRIPDFGESGLLRIHRGKKKSNALLFTTLDTMPLPSNTASDSAGPVIVSLNGAASSPFSPIEIKGHGFGEERAASAVWFSWVSGSERPYSGAYDLWNGASIKLRIPDGAVSGTVRVATAKARSNAVPLTVTRRGGTKEFLNRASYAVSYSVDVKIEEASIPNEMFLWLPVPAAEGGQINKKLLARHTEPQVEPFVENYRGTTLYKFIDVRSGGALEAALSYLVDVYAVETKIESAKVSLAREPEIEKLWLQPSAFVMSSSAAVKARSGEITGREANPYIKAQLIYRALLHDPAGSALEFTALCRASDVPARPVAGVLVTGQIAAPHKWAEFFLDGFGWVPVDVALGRGGAPSNFILPENHEEYYFGNLDNSHIAFSHGETRISSSENGAKATSSPLEYALQNVWEESSDGIKAYSSFWSDVTVNGIIGQNFQ